MASGRSPGWVEKRLLADHQIGIARQLTRPNLVGEVDPLLAYVRSMRTVLMQPDPERAGAVVDAVERRVRAQLGAVGEVRARTVVGCFVCK